MSRNKAKKQQKTRAYLAASNVYDREYEAGKAGVNFKVCFNKHAVVGYTFFGRNPDINDSLINHFLDKKNEPAQKDGYKVFFPAGSVLCEAFYFAMTAKEAGLLDNGFLKIHATDLQKSFVEYGRRGLFPNAAFEVMDEPELQKYVLPSGNPLMKKLSPEIINLVKIEPPGDIRMNTNDKAYDAVVFPHVIYHLSDKDKMSVVRSMMRLSRDVIATDYSSFDENRHIFEQTADEMGFGNADEHLNFKPLNTLRLKHSFAEKVLPWKKLGSLTDLEGRSEYNSFFASQNPALSVAI